MNSKKIDLYELHKDEYITPKTPRIVETEASRYLTITGRGEPGGIAMMKGFARGEGLKFQGLHHEIYLSDPRRVAAERLKTILRNPVLA